MLFSRQNSVNISKQVEVISPDHLNLIALRWMEEGCLTYLCDLAIMLLIYTVSLHQLHCKSDGHEV